jgi:hypothetical protein
VYEHRLLTVKGVEHIPLQRYEAVLLLLLLASLFALRKTCLCSLRLSSTSLPVRLRAQTGTENDHATGHTIFFLDAVLATTRYRLMLLLETDLRADVRYSPSLFVRHWCSTVGSNTVY